MTYVLIDLENVMPDDFSRLNREDVRTYLFAAKLQIRLFYQFVVLCLYSVYNM